MTKILALSAGDPNSISTFISLKSWLKLKDFNNPFVFVGSINNINNVINYFNFPIKAKSITLDNIKNKNKIIEDFKNFFLVLNIDSTLDFELGKPSNKNAKYVLESINTSVDLVKNAHVNAIVTNPIDKNLINEYLAQNKYNKIFLGHTEYLSDISNKKPTTMMLCTTASNLRVIPITTHVSLSDVIKNLNVELIVNKTISTHNFLKDRFKINNPKIIMLGLNPHCGENGLMGDEEQKIINPAIEKLKNLGINITGSMPADSTFTQHNINNADAIMGMYHDQVLTPFKTLYFDSGVNTTIGLDFIRTSPDHGVGFNIATTNKPSENSLISAIKMAYQLCD
jgi:4-hydroxythreonine-4-phosphate dehydrogenase